MGPVATADPILLVEPVSAGSELLLLVSGELDASSAALLGTAIDRAAAGQSRVVLDLSELEFIDASGLDVLIAGAEHLGERLGVRDPSPQVHRLLTLAGVEPDLLQTS